VAGFAYILADGFFSDNWQWLTAGGIVVVCLVLFGFKDLLRFSFRRAWAMSGVCFAESIRKRVLLIAPLAIAGVVVMTQFERAMDEQDALRQTVKYCLFATGMVVVLTSVILACTSIPKEIETKVIYTVVTKPATRLELVLGKIIGFSRVSLTMVLIMGAFTWVYLRVRSVEKQSQIAVRLRDGSVGDAERERLNAYQSAGLLVGRELWDPDVLQVYGKRPDPAHYNFHVVEGSGAQDVLARFDIDGPFGKRTQLYGPEPDSHDTNDWAHQGIGENGLMIEIDVTTKRTGPPNDQPMTMPSYVQGPVLPQTTPRKILPPFVSIDVLDENHYTFISDNIIGATDVPMMLSNIRKFFSTNNPSSVPAALGATQIRLTDPDPNDASGVQHAYAWLPPEAAASLFRHPAIYIRFSGVSGNVDYQVGEQPVHIYIPATDSLLPPQAIEVAPAPAPDGGKEFLIFRGKQGTRLDQQFDGGPGDSAVAVFTFFHAPPSTADPTQTPFQLIPNVDTDYAQWQEGEDNPTTLDIEAIDLNTMKSVATTKTEVENARPAYFTLPSAALAGGHYDVLVRCENSGHTIGLLPTSLELITATEPFETNLFKSLLVIWMMSVLVIALAVFCSTFLSWPIAIVLTVVLLVGRWGVIELAEDNAPGLGRQIVNDFRFSDEAVSTVVSTGVDALSKALNTIAAFLPDLTQFQSIEFVSKGNSMPTSALIDALLVLAGFGLPATALAYLIMKNKEVAP
jgi:hypothetical protein